MDSHDSNSSVVNDLGVQYGNPWFERWYFFMCLFYPALTVLLVLCNRMDGCGIRDE